MVGWVSTDKRLDPGNHFIVPTKTQKRWNDEGERADNSPPSECTSDTHPRDVPEHPQ
ncbi:hypothetical protein TNCV_659221 [Trichonephila clavipes]|nr:hypothetical protein TNCV_659221 [Trichonephila clavipes]